MFIVTVPAGFPSPAEDYAKGPLDLNRYLIHHPTATFFVRVKGDSMTGAGIFCGDLLVVARALMPAPGAIPSTANELLCRSRLWAACGVSR